MKKWIQCAYCKRNFEVEVDEIDKSLRYIECPICGHNDQLNPYWDEDEK